MENRKYIAGLKIYSYVSKDPVTGMSKEFSSKHEAKKYSNNYRKICKFRALFKDGN